MRPVKSWVTPQFPLTLSSLVSEKMKACLAAALPIVTELSIPVGLTVPDQKLVPT